MEETRILINASPAEVWEVLADIRNWPTWAPTVTSVTTTATDLVVGTAAELKQPKIPTAIWTVTSVKPERGFTWSSRSNGVVTTAEHELHPRDSGTEVVLRITHTGAMAFLARLFGGRMTRSYLKQEAEGLKTRVEQGRPRK
jgi:carbon monoxide dehydrogenase subunit G